jgi:hypothetical protein
MARFPRWWTDPDMATPAGVAMAARQAGVLVEEGDYTIGTFDLGDDGPPIGIQVNGSVVRVGAATWLLYPAPSQSGGWQAQPVRHRPGEVRPVAGAVPQQRVGAAYDRPDRIVARLLEIRVSDRSSTARGEAIDARGGAGFEAGWVV